jgi:hypothetical protein
MSKHQRNIKPQIPGTEPVMTAEHVALEAAVDISDQCDQENLNDKYLPPDPEPNLEVEQFHAAPVVGGLPSSASIDTTTLSAPVLTAEGWLLPSKPAGSK